ncbi:MAG: MATE family efflux transporter [Oscillospiraceae bacterium]
MDKNENIMGTRPVNTLLMGMAFPIMLSMLVQALYNIVDSIFVAMLSENALTAVSLAFPVQNLMIAVSVGTAVGINALLSRRLGEKNKEAANKVAENGIFVTVLSWLAFAVFGILCSDWFFSSFTQIEEIAIEGAKYLRICTIFSIGLFIQITMERILQVTGKTIYQMVAQLAGALTNIILDPILIFGLLGCPKMGVTGAAVATVIGQLVGMFLALGINHFKNHEVRMSFKGFKPDMFSIRGIYRVGLPSIVMQSIGSVMVFGMNKILIQFTETAVTVFGVYFKLQSFVFMPVFGITNAMVPIIAYNYGARSRARISGTIRMSLIMTTAVMLLGTIIFQLMPNALLQMFNPTAAMMEIGVPALKIISASFLFTGVSIVLSSVFQALGDGMLSLIMSIIRQMVLILPIAWILATFVGRDAVWYSCVIAEAACFVLAIIFYVRIRHKKLDNIKTISFD